MIILGIDPGYARMGVAILNKDERGKETLLFSTCVETKKETAREKRILFVAEALQKVIADYKPNVVAIEKLFFSQNQKTALLVSEIIGVVLYIAASHKLPIQEMTPLQIKMALTGYGKATKDQVQSMAQKIIKLDATGKLDDEIDAIAVAIACSSTYPRTPLG